jgi:hypothetical protein
MKLHSYVSNFEYGSSDISHKLHIRSSCWSNPYLKKKLNTPNILKWRMFLVLMAITCMSCLGCPLPHQKSAEKFRSFQANPPLKVGNVYLMGILLVLQKVDCH